MRSHFISFTTTIDGWPFLCSVNPSLKNQAPVAGLAWRAHVRIDLLRPTPEGLATQDEEIELYEVEEKILGALAGIDHAFVAQVTHQGRRTMVIYMKDELKSDHAVFALSTKKRVQFIDCINDPDWSEYKEVLYPPASIEKKLTKDLPRLRDMAQSGHDYCVTKATFLCAEPDRAERLVNMLQKDGHRVQAPTKVTGIEGAKWRIACETSLPLAEATIDDLYLTAEKTGTTFEDWTAAVLPDESSGRAKKKRAVKSVKKSARRTERRAAKRTVARRAPKKASKVKTKTVKKTAVARRKAARRGPRRG